MKITQGDVEIIKRSYENAKQKFDNLKENNQSVSEYINNHISQAKENITVKDTQLEILGEILYFSDAALMDDAFDEDINFERADYLTKEFCNSFGMDQHYFDVAKGCIEVEDYIQYLPINEAYELDKDVIKEKMGIDFDTELDFDKRVQNEVIADNIKNVNEVIEQEKIDQSYCALCSTALIFDNAFFKSADKTLSDKSRELSAFGGNKTIDDMTNDFKNLDNQFSDLFSSANNYDLEEDEAERSQNMEDANKVVNDAKDIAAQKIGIYFAMKNKKDSRSFGDKLLHPFRSIKEHFAVNKMAKSIKEQYNLTDENLQGMYDVTKTSSGVEYMGIFKRDNTSISTIPTEEQLDAKRDEITNKSYEQAMLSDQITKDILEPTTEKQEFIKENDLSKVNNLDKKTDDIKIE